MSRTDAFVALTLTEFVAPAISADGINRWMSSEVSFNTSVVEGNPGMGYPILENEKT